MSKVVGIKLTDSDYSLVEGWAKNAGVPLSRWIRNRIFDGMGVVPKVNLPRDKPQKVNQVNPKAEKKVNPAEISETMLAAIEHEAKAFKEELLDASGVSEYDHGDVLVGMKTVRVPTDLSRPIPTPGTGKVKECDHAGTEIGKLSGVGSCPKCGRTVTAKEL